MAVSQEEIPNISECFTMFCECSFDPSNCKEEASVDKVDAVFGYDQVVLDGESTELHNFRHRRRVSSFIKKPTMDAF